MTQAWGISFFADTAAKSVIVILAAWCVVSLMRKRSAATRHLVWALALCALLALPVLTAALPAWRVLPQWAARQEAPAAQKPAAIEVLPMSGIDAPPMPLAAKTAQQDSATTGAAAPAPAAPAVHGTWFPSIPLPAAILITWACGVIVSLIPLLAGVLALRRLSRITRAVSDGPWVQSLAVASERLGIKRGVSLLESPSRSMPMVWGTLRARLLVPADGSSWTSERRLVVLLHELAHVKRFDCLTRLVARIACSLYWFNPLAWLVLRRMQAESERACDDLVIAAGSAAADYADHIIEIVKSVDHPRLANRAAIAMARRSGLEGRLVAILDAKRRRGALTRMAVIAALLVAAAIVTPIAVTRAGDAAKKESEPKDVTTAAKSSVATLPSGVTVEIVGLSHNPSAGRPWWRPDGTPLTEAPYDTGAGHCWRADYEAREVAVQVAGQGARGATVALADGGGGGTAGKGGKPVEGMRGLVAFVKSGQRAATLRVGVAAGAWMTIEEFAPKGSGSTGSERQSFMYTTGIETNSGDVLAVISTNRAVEDDYRIVAIDSSGEQHSPYTTDSEAAGEMTQISAHFSGLSSDDIKGFQYQTRSYEWAEFKDISLEPKANAVPTASTAPTSADRTTKEEETGSATSAAKPFSATLSNGSTVYLVALSSDSSGFKKWWSPDGVALSDAPTDPNSGLSFSETGRLSIEAAVRLLGNNADKPGFKAAMDGTYWPATKGSKPVEGITILSLFADRGRSAGAVSFGVAVGDWKTANEFNCGGGAQQLPSGDEYTYTKVPADGGFTAVVTCNRGWDEDCRVVAVDGSGQVHEGVRTVSCVNKLRQVQTTFSGMSAGDAKFLRYQVRPYETITFENVALAPLSSAPGNMARSTTAQRAPALQSTTSASAAPGDDEQFVTCTGKVTGPNGPVAGAELVVWQHGNAPYDQEMSWHVIGKGVSGPDGAFTMTAPSVVRAEAYITAAKEGLSHGWSLWQIPYKQKEVSITLTEPKRFAGTVVDAAGAPIQGAKVWADITQYGWWGEAGIGGPGSGIDWLTTVTDSDGRFIIDRMPDRSAGAFIVSAPGYATATTANYSDYRGSLIPAGKEDIRITLPVEGRISGMVVEKATGKPVAGVRFYVASHPLGFVTSSANGAFTLTGVAAGNYRLRLPDRGTGDWVAEPVSVTLAAGQTLSGVRLEVFKGGVIEAAVKDAETGKPVERADVQLEPVPSRDAEAYGQTGADGTLRLRLLPGNYTIFRAGKNSDYTDYKSDETISIADGETKHIDVALRSTTTKITGTVHDAEGRGVAGADVRVWPVLGTTVKSRVVTDQEGHFEISYRNDGLWQQATPHLVVRAPERNLAAFIEVADPDKPIDVKLAAASIIAGRITDPSGKAVPGAVARLNMRYTEANGRNDYSIADDAPAGADGGYEIPAVIEPLGQDFVLQASAPGYSRIDETIYADGVKEGRIAAAPITLRPATSSISGKVVDSGGKPVAGAAVAANMAFPVNGNTDVYEWQPQGTETTTASDGSFTIKGVTDGMVGVGVDYNHYTLFGNKRLAANSTDAVIVIKSREEQETGVSASKPVSLIGKPLPDTSAFSIAPALDPAAAAPLLICFVDMDSRPSRRLLSDLAGRKDEFQTKEIAVALINAASSDAASVRDWAAANAASFSAGAITGKPQDTLTIWGALGLPWLVLADKDRVVRASGPALADVDECLKSMGRATASVQATDAQSPVSVQSTDTPGFEPITCGGTVVDTAGKPVEGAEVTFYHYTGSSRALRPVLGGKAVTGADGTFVIQSRGNSEYAGLITVEDSRFAHGWHDWQSRLETSPNIVLGESALVEGTIVDEEGKPIAGAQVNGDFSVSCHVPGKLPARNSWIVAGDWPSLTWPNIVTDSSGHFRYDRIPKGAGASFIVTAAGKAKVATMRRAGDMPFTAGQKDIVITLPVEGTVSGRVVDENNQAVGGLKMFINSAEGGGDATNVVASPDGTFTIDHLLSGEHTITLGFNHSTGWVAEPLKVNVRKGAAIEGITLRVARGAILEVAAVDAETGKPITFGGGVNITRTSDGWNANGALDANGVASIRALPGEYSFGDVWASSNDYKQAKPSDVVSLGLGETKRIVVKLDKASFKFTGTVRDQSGKPVAGASVGLTPEPFDYRKQQDIRTDSEGRFEATCQDMGNTRADQPLLVVRHVERALAAAVPVELNAKAIDVALAPAAVLTGTVVDPDGKPIADASVTLQAKFSESVGFVNGYVAGARTGSDGRYEMRAVPITSLDYSVEARVPGRPTKSVKVSIAAPEARAVTADPIVIRPANHFISGIVVDSSGTPMRDASVDATLSGTRDGEWQAEEAKTTTGPDGRFRLEHLTAGEISLAANSRTGHFQGSVAADSADVRLVVLTQAEQEESWRKEREPQAAVSLVGRPLPDLSALGLTPAPDPAAAKPLLICFIDMDSRPSRRILSDLAARKDDFQARGITVALINAGSSDIALVRDWAAANASSYSTGAISAKPQDVLTAWGASGLPWLVLADKDHVVRAAGAALADIDQELKTLTAAASGQ